jgi:ABC-type phosphate transport system ATPase subunit
MTAVAPHPLLEVRDLRAWYGAAQVLFGLDLQVDRGEVVALIVVEQMARAILELSGCASSLHGRVCAAPPRACLRGP